MHQAHGIERADDRLKGQALCEITAADKLDLLGRVDNGRGRFSRGTGVVAVATGNQNGKQGSVFQIQLHGCFLHVLLASSHEMGDRSRGADMNLWHSVGQEDVDACGLRAAAILHPSPWVIRLFFSLGHVNSSAFCF
jgi:hypothetical protein